MGNVHVSCTLDEDLQICRYISFVELVELLKFGQIHLEHANDFQRSLFMTAASAWRRSLDRPQAESPSAAKRIRLRNRLLRGWSQGGLAFQTWTILNDADTQHWHSCMCADQNIAIVSTAKNLAESLLVRDSSTVIIGTEDELILQSGGVAAPLHSLTGNCLPRAPSQNIGIVANYVDTNPDCIQPRSVSLTVVLSTLLSRVIVAPYATGRFFDLVNELVGENTCATVARANQPPVESTSARLPRLYAPASSTSSGRAGHSHGVSV